RATSICGQWDSVPTGVYTVYQDLWNEDAGTGSQCTTIDSLDDSDVLSWSTEWSWSGASTQVKSFANTVTNFTITTLESISTIDTIWSWSYSGTDIVADVSYDMFTSSSASGSDEYEIMIWLDAIGGAGPISSTGSTVATPELAGTTWDLYSGPNGDTTVFSFVATSAVEDFSGDLMDFLNYLIENEGLDSSQYLLSIGAGTEPFTGTSAVLSVSSYSCGV
ncbi:xyloglucanase 2, partial [Coniella lustricola]